MGKKGDADNYIRVNGKKGGFNRDVDREKGNVRYGHNYRAVNTAVNKAHEKAKAKR